MVSERQAVAAKATHPSELGASTSDSLQPSVRQLLAPAEVETLHSRAMPRDRLGHVIAYIDDVAQVECDEALAAAKQLDESIAAQVLASRQREALQPRAWREVAEDRIAERRLVVERREVEAPNERGVGESLVGGVENLQHAC